MRRCAPSTRNEQGLGPGPPQVGAWRSAAALRPAQTNRKSRPPMTTGRHDAMTIVFSKRVKSAGSIGAGGNAGFAPPAPGLVREGTAFLDSDQRSTGRSPISLPKTPVAADDRANRRKMDRRYGSRRWKAVRLRVLHRDLWRCYVPDCPLPANVADHIDTVYPGMPDAWFFDEANLRASCKRHNTARGVAARLERELNASGWRTLADVLPTTQTPMPARACEFESHLRHQIRWQSGAALSPAARCRHRWPVTSSRPIPACRTRCSSIR